MEYLLHILIMINIYIILTVSANLLVGIGGMLSLGQAAFYGVGAYASAFALIYLKLPVIPAILIAMTAGGLIGLITGLITLKMEDDYFVLGTLGIQIIIFSILYNWVSVTRGPFGISGIPSPKILGLISISGTYGFFILSSLLAISVIFLFYRWGDSPFGRKIRAFADNKDALEIKGRDTETIKIQTFIISAAFTAIAGFIYATYISYIDPTSFTLDESIDILVGLIIGGAGYKSAFPDWQKNIVRRFSTISKLKNKAWYQNMIDRLRKVSWGPIIGAVLIIALPEFLRFIGFPDRIAANMKMILFGLIILFLMRLRPEGLYGIKKK